MMPATMLSEGKHKTILWYLHHVKLFEGLGVLPVRKIARNMMMEDYLRRQKICVPGDSRDEVFVLMEGYALLSKLNEDGQRVVLRILRSGDVWGDQEVLQNVSRETEVVALDSVLVGVLKRTDFRRCLLRYPQLAANMAKSMAASLQEMEFRVTDFVFNDVRGRLAHLLVHLAGTMGHPENKGIRLPVKLTHEILANLIGTARETVSLLMRQFVRGGLILQERRYIVIADPEMLKEFASS